MITVAIVEDNIQFRDAIVSVINDTTNMALSGTYDNAEKAMIGLPKTPPDIVIVDISLPGMRGTDLIIQLKKLIPQTQFMVCSIHDDNETIFEALRCGASGYLLKDPITVDDIKKSIHDLYNGGSPMSPYIARKVLESFHTEPATHETDTLLSLREKEVLALLSKGLLYKEIADTLGISYETVKKHLKNIYQKLHVQNKIEALNKFRML